MHKTKTPPLNAQDTKKCAVFRIFSALNLLCNTKNAFLCTAKIKSIFIFTNLNCIKLCLKLLKK